MEVVIVSYPPNFKTKKWWQFWIKPKTLKEGKHFTVDNATITFNKKWSLKAGSECQIYYWGTPNQL